MLQQPHQRPPVGSAVCSRLGQDQPMALSSDQLSADDWRRIGDALRDLGRALLWQEMDRCLELANRITDALEDEPDAR